MAFIDALTGSVDVSKGRLIDLLPIAKSAFYHPDMAGSYSIKKVVPIAWAIPAIRDHFILGHGATGDPSHYSGTKDPYDGLPSPRDPSLRRWAALKPTEHWSKPRMMKGRVRSGMEAWRCWPTIMSACSEAPMIPTSSGNFGNTADLTPPPW